MGTLNIEDDYWFMRYNDTAPFGIKTLSMGSLPGGGQSEWMFPRNAGTPRFSTTGKQFLILILHRKDNQINWILK